MNSGCVRKNKSTYTGLILHTQERTQKENPSICRHKNELKQKIKGKLEK